MARTNEVNGRWEKVDEVRCWSLINAFPFGEQVEIIEHFKYWRTRLVDYTDHSPPTCCQIFHQWNALDTRRTVQPAGNKTRNNWDLPLCDATQLFPHVTVELLDTSYLVGSSKNMTGGLLISSSAMASLFFSPPESLAVLVFKAWDSPIVSKISITCATKVK